MFWIKFILLFPLYCFSIWAAATADIRYVITIPCYLAPDNNVSNLTIEHIQSEAIS